MTCLLFLEEFRELLEMCLWLENWSFKCRVGLVFKRMLFKKTFEGSKKSKWQIVQEMADLPFCKSMKTERMVDTPHAVPPSNLICPPSKEAR
jgi:hypothetical protein